MSIVRFKEDNKLFITQGCTMQSHSDDMEQLVMFSF